MSASCCTTVLKIGQPMEVAPQNEVSGRQVAIPRSARHATHVLAPSMLLVPCPQVHIIYSTAACAYTICMHLHVWPRLV